MIIELIDLLEKSYERALAEGELEPMEDTAVIAHRDGPARAMSASRVATLLLSNRSDNTSQSIIRILRKVMREPKMAAFVSEIVAEMVEGNSERALEILLF